MFSRAAGTFFLLLSSAGPALAADAAAPATTISEKLVAPQGPDRGSLLPALYVGLAGLNAYDAYTTTKGVSAGANESNALLRAAAGSPAAIWAIKGGVTAGSILLSERLWRSGHRAQAIGMMVAANSVMAVVGARNQAVVRNQR
jgi:hypothetical protein